MRMCLLVEQISWGTTWSLITHTGEKIHKCAECGDVFGTAGQLKNHRCTHIEEKPHRCTKWYYASSRVHITTYTLQKLNRCKWCDYSSITTSNRKPLQTQHLLTYSGKKSHHVREKPYKCPQCSCSSAQSSIHMNKHSAQIYYLWCYLAPCCCGPHWCCRPACQPSLGPLSTPFYMIQIWCSVLEEIIAYDHLTIDLK